MIKKCTSASETGNRKVISRNLIDLKEHIDKMEAAFATLTGKLEQTHLYHHYQEQLQDFKSELGSVRQNVLSMSADDAGDLMGTISVLDKRIHDVSIRIKEFLYPRKELPRLPPRMVCDGLSWTFPLSTEISSTGAPSGSSFVSRSMTALISWMLKSWPI